MTRGAAGAVVLGLVGCAGGAASGPAPLSNAAPGTAEERSPPPTGTIVPRTGRPRRVWYWGKMGESTWEAIYEVSPTDAGVQHVIANARRMALRFAAGAAGLALYSEQVG